MRVLMMAGCFCLMEALMFSCFKCLPVAMHQYIVSSAGPEGQTVRLLCVPKFSETGQIALLNLDTLDVQPMSFDTMVG